MTRFKRDRGRRKGQDGDRESPRDPERHEDLRRSLVDRSQQGKVDADVLERERQSKIKALLASVSRAAEEREAQFRAQRGATAGISGYEPGEETNEAQEPDDGDVHDD